MSADDGPFSRDIVSMSADDGSSSRDDGSLSTADCPFSRDIGRCLRTTACRPETTVRCPRLPGRSSWTSADSVDDGSSSRDIVSLSADGEPTFATTRRSPEKSAVAWRRRALIPRPRRVVCGRWSVGPRRTSRSPEISSRGLRRRAALCGRHLRCLATPPSFR